MERPANDVQIWDQWNLKNCYGQLTDLLERCMSETIASLTDLKIRDAMILEVGCGAGRLSPGLCKFGKVTAIDLGEKIIKIAKKNHPEVNFQSGDIFTLDIPLNSFDVIVTLGTLAHIPDQPAFVHRLSQLLKPGGFLLVLTQNKFVYDRNAAIRPPEGWIRKWVTIKTLKNLLRPEFSLRSLTTLEPGGHLGLLRFINSPRLNRYLNAVIGAPRVKRLKESAGFGQDIFVIAVKR